MASNAKQIVAYEETDHGLQPMDEERYQAFLQEGIDELDRGEGIKHSVVMAMLEAICTEAEARQKK